MNISSGLFSYQFSPKMRDSWGQNHVNHLETLKYVYTSGVISQRLYMSRYSLDTCFKDIIITVTMKIVSQQYILIPKELEIAISLISIVHALRKVSRLNNFQQLFGFFFFFLPRGILKTTFINHPLLFIMHRLHECQVISALALERCFSVEIYAAEQTLRSICLVFSALWIYFLEKHE